MAKGLRRDLKWYAQQVGPSLASAAAAVFGVIWFLRKSESMIPGSSSQFGFMLWVVVAGLVFQLARAIWRTIDIVRRDQQRDSSIASSTQFDWDDDSSSFG